MDRLSPGAPAKRGRNPLVVLIVIAGLIASSFLIDAGSADASTGSPSEAAALYSLTNQSRAVYGLGGLEWDEAAAGVARAWATTLADTGVLAHNPNLVAQIGSSVTSQWTRIGENVGYGPDASSLEAAFMASPHHKDNILGDYNRVGVGAARDSKGRLWVSVEFIKGPDLAGVAPGHQPAGNLEAVTVYPNAVVVNGWTLDPDTTAPLEVDILIDGQFAGFDSAAGSRPDLLSAFPGYGAAHGFSIGTYLPAGTHTVCVYGINVGLGVNTQLGCQTVTMAAAPVGNLEQVSTGPGYVIVGGWAIDPQTAAPVEIDVLVDGRFTAFDVAASQRPDVNGAFPGFGYPHGFSLGAALPAGTHTVCVYAINVGAGFNTALGCPVVSR